MKKASPFVQPFRGIDFDQSLIHNVGLISSEQELQTKKFKIRTCQCLESGQATITVPLDTIKV